MCPYSTCLGTNKRLEWVEFNSSQNELVENVKIHEPVGSSDDKHFNINYYKSKTRQYI